MKYSRSLNSCRYRVLDWLLQSIGVTVRGECTTCPGGHVSESGLTFVTTTKGTGTLILKGHQGGSAFKFLWSIFMTKLFFHCLVVACCFVVGIFQGGPVFWPKFCGQLRSEEILECQKMFDFHLQCKLCCNSFAPLEISSLGTLHIV